jgi:methionyl-tRNA formyltransferase
VCVVSQPDRARGRGRKTIPSPVSACALGRELPLLRPERVGDAATVEALRRYAPDVGVVVAYGQFIPKQVRELPTHGYLLNAHASLLPKLRGAAPIARAILAGETRTGISVMRIEREMDAGAVALVRELEIGPDETTGELEVRLGALAADAIAEALEQVVAGTLRWTEQDHARATEAPKLERADAALDWREPAAALVLRVRACAPRPGATTSLDGERLRILAARAVAGPSELPAGTVRLDPDQREAPLWVATGDGWLVPLRLQRAGGKALATADFLRGRAIADGTRLGQPADAG